ncbi:MAG: hypothetical protein EZS28_006900 [Streblomastix strix]|uniref:Uncharacterized protein n=1 Tax=Streblomastix strix TaxID=222440 RepID=A0A5J4WRL8_9EUKA|nr:MAG: hypothetical protein EZS28_006900 [Streblomastix strix]
MARKYFLISEVRDMLNQLEVQYDPKSTKSVLEQLLLQTIKAQGYSGPKSSVTKIGEFVHSKVQEKPAINVTGNNDANNEQNNEENNDSVLAFMPPTMLVMQQNNEENNEQDLIQLQQQRIKAKQELKLAAEKLDGINKQIELRQQVTKLQEWTNQLANDSELLNEIKVIDTVKKSIRNRQQINDAKRQLQELKDKQVQQINEIKQQRIKDLNPISQKQLINTRAMFAHNIDQIQLDHAAKKIQRQYQRHKERKILTHFVKDLSNTFKQVKRIRDERLSDLNKNKLTEEQYTIRQAKLTESLLGFYKNKQLQEPDLKFNNEYNANIDDKLKAFMLFQPDDLKKFNEILIDTRKRYREQNEVDLAGLSDRTAQTNNVQNREPYHTYYFNKFTHLQQFDDKLAQVHELHKNKIYKIAVDFGSIWQTTQSTRSKNGIRNDYSYHYYKPSLQNSHKNYPIIIRDNASLKLFKDRVHDMIYEDQSPLHQESNNRKVALYSFVIIVYELPLGTKLRPEVQWFNEHDYTRSIDCGYNICWFIAASFQLHPEINQTKTRIANAIELFLQFNDQVHKEGGRLSKQQKQLLKEYDGFNQDTDLEKFQQCFKLNVMTYEFDHSEKQFNKTNEYIVNQEWVTTHILLAPLSIQGDENPQVHAMFIKDIDRVVGGYLCKKCNQKLFNRTSAHFGRDLKTHIESCKGPDQMKHPNLDKLSQPFMPYLKQNKTIQKLFATGQTKLFPKDQEQGVSDILQPTKNYMCIDAETVEEQDQENDQIYAQLKPLSIVIGTQINNKIQSKYIDIRTQDFMNKFIEQMWELANGVNEANLACEPIVKFDNENEQQKHQQKIHQVAIFGFNSKNNAYLGSTTQQKQVTIRHTDYPFELVFKDVLTFIPPTTLDNFVHKYRNGTKLTKGKFPHGSFNTNNVNQFLSSTEPFEHKDFYNQINRKNISDKEYQEYVVDFTSSQPNGSNNFKDRWSYLQYYNIRDVECMFAPINNLIDICWEQGIDMLSQISLSQIANSIKYNYAWEDFDINGDYNIETGNKEYKFYSEKWNKKVESYIQQDNKAGRDTTNNVTAYDMDYFNQMIPNKCCYCQAKFTNVNKPTLERIDNNIAHTKDNCKLACQLCNSTRSNKDADVAKLMIQMFKYAIVKNLHMTIDDEEVYWFLRKSIHGGLSQVFYQQPQVV